MDSTSRSLLVPLILLVFAALVMIGCGENRQVIMQRAAGAIEAGDLQSAKTAYLRILNTREYDLEAIQGMIDVTKTLDLRNEHIHWCQEMLKYRPWDRYANLAVGIALLENGELADAGNRLILAYMDSVFRLDREETLRLLETLRQRQAQLPRENDR